MNSSNRNRQLPRAGEENSVIRAGHQDARLGGLVGGLVGAGTAGALLRKRRALGAAGVGLVGAITGAAAGRRVGIDRGARDVRAARKALNSMEALEERLQALEARAVHTFGLDKSGNDFPSAFPQIRPLLRPSVRGQRSEPGDGVSSEAVFAEARESIAARWGWGIAASLADDELDDAHAEELWRLIQGKIGKTDSPSAGVRSGEDFERAVLAQHLGSKTVDAMSFAEVHCHFVGAQRRGLITLEADEATTNLSLIDRPRNREGQFEPGESLTPDAIRRAYHTDPRVRRTGKDAAPLTAAGAAAGLLSAAAYMRSKGGRRPRLSPGIPKLNPPTIDIDSTGFSMTAAPGPGRYSIRRRTLRGKKQPGLPRVKVAGKTNLAFLINDPDFPLLPLRRPKLKKGMRQRMPYATTKKEVIERVRANTELGLGKLIAEGALDAFGESQIPGLTPEQVRQRQKRIAAQRDASESRDLGGALKRAADAGFLDQDGESDFSALTSGIARDVAAIGAADLGASQVSDAINRARERRRRKARAVVKGGIQQDSGVPGDGPTQFAIDETLTEFDGNGQRERARRRAAEAGAVGAGGLAGAVGGLKYDQGRPVRPGDIRPGDVLYRRFGPAGLAQHHGVVGADGKVTHRTARSDTYRAIKPESFRKVGSGPTYREDRTSNHLPRGKAAKNASKAAGTSAGAYRVGANDCQGAAARLATRRVPASGQLRRALGGAALGAAAGAAAAHVLSGKRRKDRNAS